ncbi:hypothetical protein [Mycoavidus cysteinexigens]|uniref:hypothetical protein n=1 Tax=Mycoavidus cysteinexigens TaxID=1553431 RepID=UPI000F83D0D7|nr:hypothetical protein [Mycoavidus cysteinexigens]
MKDKKRPRSAAKSTKSKIDASALAAFVLKPSANAAAIVSEYATPLGEQNFGELAQALANSIIEVQSGDMRRCEAMLMAQAQALQSIFMNFSRRTLCQEYQKNFESFFRMAMKAQNQCRMTLETLATLKNPPVIYAKQANIAHGHQQVNNGVEPLAHAEKITIESNELLEKQNGQWLDARAKDPAAGHDSTMATVGKIDGAANG